MSLSKDQTYVDQLMSEAEEFGIVLDERQAVLMLRHLDLMLEKNKDLNLTRITEPSAAVRLHDLDSILLAPYLTTEDRFLDVGTGAGFPGVPLAIASGAKGTLLDSLHKRMDAVSIFVRELGLEGQLEVVAERAENFAKQRRGEYDVVVARAVAQVGVLLEYATPFLSTDGRVVISKGDPSDEEFAVGEDVAQLCGLENVSRETLELPEGSGQRTILVYKRVVDPKIRLPRKPGMATKRPLGR